MAFSSRSRVRVSPGNASCRRCGRWSVSAQLAPYAAIVAPHDATHYGGQADPLISNGLAVHLAPELNENIAASLRSGAAPWAPTMLGAGS